MRKKFLVGKEEEDIHAALWMSVRCACFRHADDFYLTQKEKILGFEEK